MGSAIQPSTNRTSTSRGEAALDLTNILRVAVLCWLKFCSTDYPIGDSVRNEATDTPGTPTSAGQTTRHLGETRVPGIDAQSFDRTGRTQGVLSRGHWDDDPLSPRRRRNAGVQSLGPTRRRSRRSQVGLEADLPHER